MKLFPMQGSNSWATLIGTPVHLQFHLSSGTVHKCKSLELQVMSPSNIRIGEKAELCGFNHGMVIGPRWTGLSISETAGLLGLGHNIQVLHL